MKLCEIKLLTDENISPRVVTYLREKDIDVLDVKEEGWQGQVDEILLDIAHQENRFVLTHDSDFGTLAVNQNKPCYGILYLRLKNLKASNVSNICEKLLQSQKEILPQTIWVIEETRIRIRDLVDTSDLRKLI